MPIPLKYSNALCVPSVRSACVLLVWAQLMTLSLVKKEVITVFDSLNYGLVFTEYI